MVLLPLQVVTEGLKKAELLGLPYIPTDFRPSVFLQLEYPEGVQVTLGNSITPQQAVEAPKVSFTPEDPTATGETYTLLSFDPDAPSREDQKFGPWRHWIQSGLVPTSIDEVSTKGAEAKITAEAITPWTGPSPGAGTGPHRYTFLLYKEKKPTKSLEEQSTLKSNERIDRRNFQVVEFVRENELELVGANYFYCEVK